MRSTCHQPIGSSAPSECADINLRTSLARHVLSGITSALAWAVGQYRRAMPAPQSWMIEHYHIPLSEILVAMDIKWNNVYEERRQTSPSS